jgi:hypothetical protein
MSYISIYGSPLSNERQNMKRFAFALAAGLMALAGSSVSAQESAKVTVTVKIPAKVASFSNQKLEVLLLQEDPAVEKGPFFAAKFVNPSFSHITGKETKLEIVLGEKVKITPRMQYTISVYVLDSKTNKRLLIGERDGQSGPCIVLTRGASNKATMIVTPVK